MTKREIIRCLKRYIAREPYHALRADLADLEPARPSHAFAVTCGAGFTGRDRRTRCRALDIYRNVRGNSTAHCSAT
jgi:hypothetical protein